MFKRSIEVEFSNFAAPLRLGSLVMSLLTMLGSVHVLEDCHRLINLACLVGGVNVL